MNPIKVVEDDPIETDDKEIVNSRPPTTFYVDIKTQVAE